MFVEHPEFPDILVDIITHQTVESIDNVNVYLYKDNAWNMTGIDLLSEPLSKEEYILHYCRYDEKLCKHVYSFKN